MALTDAVTINFSDIAGNVGQLRGRMLQSGNDSTVTGSLDALQAVTDLRLNSWTRAKENAYTGVAASPPGAGHRFADNEAKLVLVFQTANPVVKPKLEIMGPKELVAFGNDYSIDPEGAQFADLEAAAIAVMTSRGGAAVTALEKGHGITKHLRHADG